MRDLISASCTSGVVNIAPAGSLDGTDVLWNDIIFNEKENGVDVVVGHLPPRLFNQCADITSHLASREDFHNLKGKTAVMLSPHKNHVMFKTGPILGYEHVEMMHPLKRIESSDAVVMRLKTSKGECGAVYILDSNDSRRIFAIHAAGFATSQQAYGAPIYQEMFIAEHQAPELNEEDPTTFEMQKHPLQQGNGNVQILGTKTPKHTPVKSQIVKTAVHNMIFETTVAPAALAPYNRAGGPMLKALEKTIRSRENDKR